MREDFMCFKIFSQGLPVCLSSNQVRNIQKKTTLSMSDTAVKTAPAFGELTF